MISFSQLKERNSRNTVTLPDEMVKVVKYIGHVMIKSILHLKDVLYIPNFKYNMLPDHKLAEWDSRIFV